MVFLKKIQNIYLYNYYLKVYILLKTLMNNLKVEFQICQNRISTFFLILKLNYYVIYELLTFNVLTI